MTYEEQFESLLLEDASEDQIIKWLLKNKYVNQPDHSLMPSLRRQYEPLWAEKNRKIRACVAAYGCDMDTLEELITNGDTFIKKTVLRNTYYGTSIGFLVTRQDRKNLIGQGIIENWEVFSNAFYNTCLPYDVVSDLVNRRHHFSHTTERMVLESLNILFNQGYIDKLLEEIDYNKEKKYFSDENLYVEDILRFIAKIDVEPLLAECAGRAVYTVAFKHIQLIIKLLTKILGEKSRRFHLTISDSEIRKFDPKNYDKRYFENASQYIDEDYGLTKIQGLLLPHAFSLPVQRHTLLSDWYSKSEERDDIYLMYCFQYFTLEELFSVKTQDGREKYYEGDMPDIDSLDWSKVSDSKSEDATSNNNVPHFLTSRINSYLNKNHRAFACGITTNSNFYKILPLRKWLLEFCRRYDSENGQIHISGNDFFRGDMSSTYEAMIEHYNKIDPLSFK